MSPSFLFHYFYRYVISGDFSCFYFYMAHLTRIYTLRLLLREYLISALYTDHNIQFRMKDTEEQTELL